MNDCGQLLKDIDRLEALRKTELYGTTPEESFTRLNRLATKALKAPISIFSLIGENSQFFKSAAGFEIGPTNNEVPIDVSVCQYSLIGKPLSIENTIEHLSFKDNPAVKALNIVGYLGVPVITKSGHAIGAVCVIDHKKREWTKDEIEMLEEITASFVSEIELRQTMKKLENESIQKDEFIAIASHELKNPIASINLQTQLILSKIKNSQLQASDSDKFLNSFKRNTSKLLKLIDDMSDATRLSTGELHLQKQVFNLNEMVLSILESLNETLTKSENKISLCMPVIIHGSYDSIRIEQVITNILLNASKYAPKSEIKISLFEDGSFVQLEIQDNGPGISPDDQTNIFKKYYRASSLNQIQGLGLGLYLSRKIIEQHGGSLKLACMPNEGSKFIIRLPRNR